MLLIPPAMILMAAFALTAGVGIAVAMVIASFLEPFSKMASLVLFLVMLMLVIPIAWRVAVRLTEPKQVRASAGEPSSPPPRVTPH